MVPPKHTNWTRLSRSGRAVIASVVAFLLGNGLMVVAGAWCAMVYQQADIVEVMMLQGLSFAAVVMLCLNLWTIQGPTIYNVSAACHLLRSERRRTATLVTAARVGVVLAIGGMYEMLIPFLVLLGSIIPPVGGVIMADFLVSPPRQEYPALATVRLPRYNLIGLFAYAVGAVLAYAPWVAPLVGIGASACATSPCSNWAHATGHQARRAWSP